ncbi:hypothetical protein MKJ01_14250 [Chryseobacterium sp. SSA4.19]|uniref:hypothetical protein n=1 Tax=Chryseobacterium sp. SSA4.19 TaxID=2919915 RepID=UPI001F4E2BA4|nr:hypothetical protein [Chryseobacterium sp. SSA4.19]MCJ8154926.1 hypothetical protein [Chryseobacterium sp. SSA4.19]
MKKAKFNAKEFLKAKTLSPLEQNQLRGGFGEAEAAEGVVVVVRVVRVVQQVQRVIGL